MSEQLYTKRDMNNALGSGFLLGVVLTALIVCLVQFNIITTRMKEEKRVREWDMQQTEEAQEDKAQRIFKRTQRERDIRT